jgi:hypothetical protein
MAYMIGIVPALIVAVFDPVIRNARYRILWTSPFAYAAGFMPTLARSVLGFGLIGAVPGTICSWLAGSGDHRKHVASA